MLTLNGLTAGKPHSEGRCKRFRWAAVLLLTVGLAACGDGMTGTYTGGLAEDQVLTFHGNGKATQETAGMEVQLEYEVDGDRIKLHMPDQPGTTLVLTRKDADTLTGGPMGVLEYKRKQ